MVQKSSPPAKAAPPKGAPMKAHQPTSESARHAAHLSDEEHPNYLSSLIDKLRTTVGETTLFSRQVLADKKVLVTIAEVLQPELEDEETGAITPAILGDTFSGVGKTTFAAVQNLSTKLLGGDA